MSEIVIRFKDDPVAECVTTVLEVPPEIQEKAKAGDVPHDLVLALVAMKAVQAFAEEGFEAGASAPATIQ